MPIPVINIAQMREWESATWATGQTEAEVIRRVGKKIARRARKLTRSDDLILILAGKGHNGDDARAAQEFLDGRRVEMLAVTDPQADLPKLEDALKQKPALVIDGLFGIGLNRTLDDGWKKFITTVNASKIPVLSVDVPSGLNADTGETFGAAIEAAVTLTVGAPKTGLLAPAAWPFVGRFEVAGDVGLVPCPHTGDLKWTLPDDFENFPPRRIVAGHKGSFGHLAIVAGSFGYHGAAVLATRAAQRAQPGLVTLFTQENVYHAAAAQLQSAMVKVWTPEIKLAESASGVLIGPGLAALDVTDQMKGIIRRLLARLAIAGGGGRDRAGLADGAADHGAQHRPRRHAASRRGRADAQLVHGARAGGPPARRARNLAPVWRLLGGAERPPDLDWPERGRNLCQPVRQPASGAGRQRRRAGGLHRGTARATGVAGGRGEDHPLRRLAARGRGG